MAAFIAAVMFMSFMPGMILSVSAADFAGGSGTASNPYQIKSQGQLRNIEDYNNSTTYFKLTDDITLNVWYPIGGGNSDSKRSTFKGHFDGGGHTLTIITWCGLAGKTKSIDYQGIFALNSGEIQNLKVKIGTGPGGTTGDYRGYIAGRNDGIISNCTSSGKSKTSKNYMGGIAGVNYGTITGCHNGAEIYDGTNYIGGIAGANYGTISNCYNDIEITNDGNYTGGIAGYSEGTITNCYNTAKITSSGKAYASYTGGITGYQKNGLIEKCYNDGNIVNDHPDSYSSGINVGGVAGAMSNGTINNCYNRGSITGNKYIGGISGYSSGSISNCYNTNEIFNNTGDLNNYYLISGSNTYIFDNCYSVKTSKYSNVRDGGSVPGAIGYDIANFRSGLITWLLQKGQNEQIWGQNIGTDDHPLLTPANDKRVRKVQFISNFYGLSATAQNAQEVRYVTNGKTIEPPATRELEGYIFNNWLINGYSDRVFTSSTPVEGDWVIYAAWRVKYGAEDSEIRATYGKSITYDLCNYIKYYNGSYSSGYTFTIIDGNSSALNASITKKMNANYSILNIPNTAKPGTYTLTIKAHEESPLIKTYALNYGTDDVTFTITVIVDKATPVVTVPKQTTFKFIGKPVELLPGISTTAGRLQFSLDGSKYSTAVPTATEPGKYTVWYKVVGDSNYNDIPATSVEVEILTVDPVELLKHLSGISELTDVQLSFADYTDDGTVDFNDVIGLLKYRAGNSEPFMGLKKYETDSNSGIKWIDSIRFF